MTIGAEEQTNSNQGVGTTHLKSELRCLLAEDFRKRLTESALISEEQCKRLCGLLKERQNLTDISKALGVPREQVSKSYKKKAVELVTEEFVELAKSGRGK